MSIFCEINISRPASEEFKPGDAVSGLIGYEVDEKTVFNKITVSLKGYGYLRIVNRHHKEDPKYYNKEEYVNNDNVIVDSEIVLPIGEYETKFSFKLPENIPPSFVYHNNKNGYCIKCKIFYFIQIKFNSPDVLRSPELFKKEIKVGTVLTSSLLKEPTVYSKQKEIVQLFSGNNTITIKAGIDKSVINNCEMLKFHYKVINDTNVAINSVEVKLVEVHTFNATGLQPVKRYNKVKETKSRTASIKGGDIQKKHFEIIVPFDKKTLQHSKIVSRDYFVKIRVLLPLFRQNFALYIPIEVGDENLTELFETRRSYWEVMDECKVNKVINDKEHCITNNEI
ncbi:arrestin domain-containing protein 5-like [Galleria mellonella]|uniref:Arrestin domain-containing protein 5-like n=1 Tax=Galleria mellonella TaxID=7137 RepID=A0A6J1WKH6_GALME|nr:arrestin domain-containing protein 5-like [Galleria mellonella]